MWITFLKAYWHDILVIALLLAVIGYIDYIRRDNKSLSQQITQQKLLTQELGQANSSLKTSIDTQNKSIQDWADKSKIWQDNFGKTSAQLIVQQAKTNASVQAIAKQPTPTDCQSSLKYLRDHAQLKGDAN